MSEQHDANELYRPLTEEERLAIRAELRERNWSTQERNLAVGKEGQKLFAQHHHAERQATIANAADFQKVFIRFGFLLNGSAIIALLTLIGALGGKGEPGKMSAVALVTRKLLVGVEFFIAGLSAATLSAGIAMFAWQFSAGTFFHAGHTSNMVSGFNPMGGLDEKEEENKFAIYDRFLPWFMNGIALFALSSVLLFIIGAYKTKSAFTFFRFLQ